MGLSILLGAPLGNAGDASGRLREVLAGADIVAAEDTRRLHRLARDLEITDRRPDRVLLRGQRAAAYPGTGRRARRRRHRRA